MSLLRLLLPLLPELLRLLPGPGPGARRVTRRLVLQAELVSALVLILLAAAGFGVAAAYMALAAHLSPPAAAGLMALALTGVGAALAVALAVLHREPRGPRPGQGELAADAAARQLAELGKLAAEKPLASVLVAAAVGLAVASLGRRR